MRPRGFTLIEIAVVLAITAFLVAALAAASVGMCQKSKAESTKALVRSLEAGCESYRAKLGEYPGGPSGVTSDTTILHRTLCVPFAATEGNAGGRGKLIGPFVELAAERAKFAPQIHDDWGWPVRYTLPGSHNTHGFDVDASSAEGGAIGNWVGGR